MTRHPYGPDELDREDAALDSVAERLERYAAERRPEPPAHLASRVRDAIDEEPLPRAGWLASATAGLRALRAPARGLAAGAIVVAAVVGALALGELSERARQTDVGSTPEATPFVTPTATPTPTPSPSPTSSPSPTPSASPSASPSPTASDDDDEVETPEPSEDDNSGPGGGDEDSSGPGSGDGSGDDNSGPGGG